MGGIVIVTAADCEARELYVGRNASTTEPPAWHYGDKIIELAERIKTQRQRSALLAAVSTPPDPAA